MANRALLVGINAYPSSPLRGCLKDVENVRQRLMQTHSFADGDIRLLTDAAATTAGIKSALADYLVKDAQPGDRLVFHYSGHGSQLPAGNVVHDVICPVDFNFDETTALSDVDFSAIFDHLPQGVLLTWVSDSCHSGDLARGLARAADDRRPRFLPPPPEIQAQIDAIRRRTMSSRTLAGHVENLRGVLLAGCRSDEESADAQIKGEFCGAFTYFLLHTLGTSADTPLKDVIAAVNKALDAGDYMQHPQLRGADPFVGRPFLSSSPANLAGAAHIASATEDEVAASRAGRDYGGGRGLDDDEASTSRSVTEQIPKERIAALISPEAHALVITEEIGSQADYEHKYKFPEYPGGESGVTIGFGYDIGQLSNTDFAAAWDGLLPAHDYDLLKACVSLTGQRAKQAVPSVKGIIVPWDRADTSYHRYTVDKFGQLTAKAFPNALELHPHSFGALYSLVYNRGARMTGDTRTEMRAIRDHMAARRFDLVPGEIRGMRRLWANTPLQGLVKRREKEAELFERGLKAAAVAGPAPPSPVPVFVAAAPTAPAPVQTQQQQLPAARDQGPTPVESVPPPPSQAPQDGADDAPVIRRRRGTNRVALVIGNGDYETFKPLPNAVEDAKLITTKLESVGFGPIIGGAGRTKWGNERPGQNLTKARLDALAETFFATIRRDDTVAIYYAGHGLQIGDRNYIVPVDAKLAADNPNIFGELLDLNELVARTVGAVGAKGHVLVFLDACRNNPMGVEAVEAWAKNQDRKQGRQFSTGPGLAVWTLSGENGGSAARQFIAYATAPGATAADGADGSANSPFASSLGRHIDTCGLTLDECFERVGSDVQAATSGNAAVQDPWKAANIQELFYFVPRTWTPMAVLGSLGLVVGYLIALLTIDHTCVIDTPLESPRIWWALPLFATLNGVGTLTWGRARTMDARGLRDLLFAVVGAMASIAAAIVVLQLIREPWHGATSIVSPNERAWAAKAFASLAVTAGVLMSISILSNPDRTRGRWNAVFDYLAPLILTGALWSLGHRLFDIDKTHLDIRMIMISLVAGVLCAAGNALSCGPQLSVFRGFNAMVGAVTVGLVMPAMFDLLYLIPGVALTEHCNLHVAQALSALWFGLLGAELGYCFAYYVPEYEPLPARPRRTPL